ncbi:uncharacterized protein LOC125225814 isoform X1 [Leguminivora glycinivorella]|uniref:uncharacterized protein LOC125225814 isoform X1 n=1 Tax=Leguminivora glycinivorella TaxID=1035111 RepID=UPI00200CBD31|nr:uncharacterized protein LOC125225814 isoform X1 [Leguminivora glycinivorella]
MHGFSDSSLTAFGCAIYIRTINMHGQILTRLLCSKSRIARKETIPRLELRAMLLLAQLYKNVTNALKCKFTKVYLWCDSNVTLAWAKSQKQNNLNCFVKNRVIEIQGLTNINDWHWVSSNDNPADLLTRGLPADKLINCTLWWEGPSWLSKCSDTWPCNSTSTPLPDSELTETHCNTTTNSTNVQPNIFIDNLFRRWSDVNKLINCVAFIYRFVNNCLIHNKKLTGPLSVRELECALNKLIEMSQIEMFPTEYNLLQNKKPLLKSSNLLSLNPFMENRLIRVGGRLGLSAYDYNKKHPIILSHKHILTKLIMSDLHVRLLHAGAQLLLSSIRERFWPINAAATGLLDLLVKGLHRTITGTHKMAKFQGSSSSRGNCGAGARAEPAALPVEDGPHRRLLPRPRRRRTCRRDPDSKRNN